MKALIIEDDARIIDVISLAFRIRWPESKMISTNSGERGIMLVEEESPDVVILDIGLPDINGFEVLKSIRLFSSVPVIILTVLGEEENVVKGLELGADEYITKPFRQMELLSRVQALVRRTGILQQNSPSITVGHLRFGPSMGTVFSNDVEIKLTRTEGLILYYLMKNVNKTVTYATLSEVMWGREYEGTTESLRVHIRRLREKLETDPSKPVMILTHTGLGYMLRTPEEKQV
jgi:two-component system response regulator VicR